MKFDNVNFEIEALDIGIWLYILSAVNYKTREEIRHKVLEKSSLLLDMSDQIRQGIEISLDSKPLIGYNGRNKKG